MHPDLLSPVWFNNFEYEFKFALGETAFGWHWNNEEYRRKLVGWVKNGDTIGTVYNDTYYLDINPITDQGADFEFYPNPATSNITIQLGNENRQLESIRIFQLNGQLVKSVDAIFSATYTLHRGNINSGCYFVEVRDSKGYIRREKLVFL